MTIEIKETPFRIINENGDIETIVEITKTEVFGPGKTNKMKTKYRRLNGSPVGYEGPEDDRVFIIKEDDIEVKYKRLD